MDFRLTEDQELLRRSVREFAETEIRPHVVEWDNAQHFPIELVPKLAGLGLMGIQCPEDTAGRGCRRSTIASASRSSRASIRPSRCRWPHTTGLCSSHILMFGTDAQKQQYLVPLARGEKIGAWGLTESSSGSDAAGMRTMATRAGSQWVLNGSKTFTTHGRTGDILVAMAITDRVDRKPRHLRVHHREGHARV